MSSCAHPSGGDSHLHAKRSARRQQQGAAKVEVGEGLAVRHVQRDAAGQGKVG